MSSSSPLVSVVLAVYNERIDFLKVAVESVLAQSHRNLEFLIVDDSDEQRVVSYMENAAKRDDRVIYIHNQKKSSRTKARNIALKLAKGDYIAIVDSDDIQSVDRFAEQIAFLDANQDIGIVGTSLEKINEKGETLGIRRYPVSPESIKKTMMLKNTVAQPSVMIRRQVLAELGCYDERFIKAEDYEMWMRAVGKGIKIANMAEPLVKYRISNVEKRDNVNWACNVRVKLRYFAFDRYLFGRVAGIAAVGLVVILPLFIKRFLYSIYNRIS